MVWDKTGQAGRLGYDTALFESNQFALSKSWIDLPHDSSGFPRSWIHSTRSSIHPSSSVCPQIQWDSRNDSIQFMTQAKTSVLNRRMIQLWGTWMLEIGLTLFLLNWHFRSQVQPKGGHFFFQLMTQVPSARNESSQLTAQVRFPGIASTQLLTQASFENIN